MVVVCAVALTAPPALLEPKWDARQGGVVVSVHRPDPHAYPHDRRTNPVVRDRRDAPSAWPSVCAGASGIAARILPRRPPHVRQAPDHPGAPPVDRAERGITARRCRAEGRPVERRKESTRTHRRASVGFIARRFCARPFWRVSPSPPSRLGYPRPTAISNDRVGCFRT